jgi:hypothetical protein
MGDNKFYFLFNLFIESNMRSINSLYLLIVIILLVGIELISCKKTIAKSSEEDSEGDNENSVVAKEHCKCCEGEGLKCGHRLKDCEGNECVDTHLYLCEKEKDAFLYESCKLSCIADTSGYDFCTVVIDPNFFYFKKRKSKVDSTESTKKSGAPKKKSSGKALSKGKPKVMSFSRIENGNHKYDDEDGEEDNKDKNQDK